MPSNVNAISFGRPWRILLAGLLVSLATLVVLKARENAPFRDALGIVAVAAIPGGRVLFGGAWREWDRFHTSLLLELAKTPDVRLLSATHGRVASVTPAEFWDIRCVVKGHRVAIDCHTIRQRWDGLIGSSDEQARYCARLAAMAGADEAIGVIVLDRSPSDLGTTSETQSIFSSVNQGHASAILHLLGGAAPDLVASIVRLAAT